jgi:hypothetical protein
MIARKNENELKCRESTPKNVIDLDENYRIYVENPPKWNSKH